MYTGNNKIALQSKKEIQNSLLILLEKKDYNSISISELCKKAQVSRQTFYTLYKTKENIVIDLFNNVLYNPNIPKREDGKFNVEKYYCYFSNYLIANYKVLKLFEKNNLLHYLYSTLYSSIIDFPNYFTNYDDKTKQYIASFIASGYMAITYSFLANNGTDNSDYLIEKMNFLFSGLYLNKN